jgi:excisionase family DNA binding protein
VNPNIVFDAHEAASYLNVHYETVLRMSRRKELPHHRIGRKLLFRKDSLDAWIQERERMSVLTEKQQENTIFFFSFMVMPPLRKITRKLYCREQCPACPSLLC